MFSKNYLNFHSGCAAYHPQQYFRLTFRLAQERVTYNKEIQTADLESDSSSTSDGEVREPMFRERDITVEAERALERLEVESAALDREIEEEIRGLPTFFFMPCSSVDERTDLTEEERISVLAAPEFLDFVEQSSKIVQRALNDNYDYIRDYTSGAETGG
jgi:dynein intermediate chain